MKHLSDSQIQELLSEDNRLHKSFYDNHLSTCSECRAKLAEYKNLFTKLEYADDIKISPDFTKKVLSQALLLLPKESVFSKFSLLLTFAIATSTLIVLEMLGIIGLAPVLQVSSAFISKYFSMISAISTISTTVVSWLPSLNVSYELVAIGVLAASFYHLLDLFLIRPRFR